MRYFPLLTALFFVSQLVYAIAIQLSKDRNMQFATSSPNDGAAIIVPGSSASTQYTVTGNAGATFDITFPSGTINMTNGGNIIGTTTWTSDVTSPATLDGSGTLTFYIGATRDALGAGQASGNYSGNHSVSVQYTGGVGIIRTLSAAHTVTVLSSISISKSTDLQFADATRNDIAATVVPGVTSASFTVTGEANMVYTVSLPADGTIKMTTAGGGADKEIAVNSFASSPSGTGTLSGAGTDTLYVGATRAAITNTQVAANDYTGTFLVTVTYQ